MGAPFADKYDDNQAYVIFGGAQFIVKISLAGLDGTDGFRLIGEDAADLAGLRITSA